MLQAFNVRPGEQRLADFVALYTNARVPVLVAPGDDGKTFVLTESAAILVYLAERHCDLLPAGGDVRARVFKQLFFQASSLGPAFGQSDFSSVQACECRLQLPASTMKPSAR